MKEIAILSVPRSGSSWVGQIFNSCPSVKYKFQPNFAYSFPLNLEKDSNKDEIKNFHQALFDCKDPFVNHEISISGKETEKFSKTEPKFLVWKEVHSIFLAETLLKNSSTKVVGLVRSPFSVIYSWINVPKEFDPTWNVLEQWRSASLKNKNSESFFFGFDKWKEAVKLFLYLNEKFPQHFYLLNYDDLISNPKKETLKMFTKFGIEMTTQTENFIYSSTSANNTDAYSVYKSKVRDDQWKGKLSPIITEEIKSDLDFQGLNKIFKWI